MRKDELLKIKQKIQRNTRKSSYIAILLYCIMNSFFTLYFDGLTRLNCSSYFIQNNPLLLTYQINKSILPNVSLFHKDSDWKWSTFILNWIIFISNMQIVISFYPGWIKIQINIHLKDLEEIFQKNNYLHSNPFWTKRYDCLN